MTIKLSNVAVIRHLAFEGLGLLETVFDDRNIAITIYDAGIQDIEQAIIQADLVILLGGPISVYETDRYPFLQGEIQALQHRLNENKPTLGICLGAQLIVTALGSRVYTGEGKEIGWSQLTLTPQGLASCLSYLDHIPVLHWHGDTFDLPPKAQRLASTGLYENQAFSITNNILALQFHVEVNPLHIEQWLIGHCGELAQAGIEPSELRQQAANITANATIAAHNLLNAWLDNLSDKDDC